MSPGFISLIDVLTTSISSKSKKSFQFIEQEKSQWINEYLEGSTMEIYTVNLTVAYKDVEYTIAASSIYKEFGACLFALGIMWEGSVNIILNPIGYVMKGDEVGYVITSDLSDIADIAFGTRFSANVVENFDFLATQVVDQTEEDEPTENSLLITDEIRVNLPSSLRTKHSKNSEAYTEHIDAMRISVSKSLKMQEAGSRNDLVYRGPKIDDIDLSSRQAEYTDEFQRSSALDLFKTPLPPTVEGHILICSLSKEFPAHLAYFIAVVRYKEPTRPIVILSMATPLMSGNGDEGVEDWEWLQLYSYLYHVEGLNKSVTQGLP